MADDARLIFEIAKALAELVRQRERANARAPINEGYTVHHLALVIAEDDDALALGRPDAEVWLRKARAVLAWLRAEEIIA